MFKMELMKILSKKILWVGITAVLVFSFSIFYNATLEPYVTYFEVRGMVAVDGEFRETAEVDYDRVIYNNLYEKIQKAKEMCKPYIGRELTDELVTELIILKNEMTKSGQSAVDVTGIDRVFWNFRTHQPSESLWEYSKKEDYREIKIDDELLLTQTVDYFHNQVKADKPLIFNYGEGWGVLSENLAISLMVGLILVVVVLATVFSSEHKYRMIGQILTSRYGKNKIITAKIMASLSLAFIVYAIITIQNLIMYGLVYGFGGMNTDLILTFWSNHLYKINAGITVFELFLSVIICGLVVYMAVVIITLLISVCFQNEYISGITSFVLYYIPQLIGANINPNLIRAITIMVAMLPANIFALKAYNNYYWHWYVSSLSVFELNIPMQVVIVILYSLISLIGVFLIHRRFRNTQVA